MSDPLANLLALLPKPQDGKAWQERIHDLTRPMTAPPKEKK